MTDHAHPEPHDPAHDDTHEHHPPGGVGKYVLVFIALCILTAISFTVGNWPTLRQNSPGAMWAMMMAVSCCKALLVILFFMHVLWEANWKYVLTIPASMMSIFLLLMLVPDIGRRTDRYSSERWLHAAEPEPQRVPGKAAHAHDHDHPHADKADGQPGGKH